MGLLDFFSNNHETHEKDPNPLLKTRYYRCRKQDVKQVLLEIAVAENAKVAFEDDRFNETLFESPKFSCTMTLSNPNSPMETGVDFKITTNYFIGANRGIKLIAKFYKHLDSKLTFAGTNKA